MTTYPVYRLHYDAQDPRNSGWYLSAIDEDGCQSDGSPIDCAERHASAADLAPLLAETCAALRRRSLIRVTLYRGDRPAGWVEVQDGAVVRIRDHA